MLDRLPQLSLGCLDSCRFTDAVSSQRDTVIAPKHVTMLSVAAGQFSVHGIHPGLLWLLQVLAATPSMNLTPVFMWLVVGKMEEERQNGNL